MSSPHDLIITGDFNIHVNDHNNTQASQFLSLLTAYNLHQIVDFPTHTGQNTLDLFILPEGVSHTASVSSHHISPSDHLPVICSLTLSIPAQRPHTITKTFRRIKNIDLIKFECDIKASSIFTNLPDTLSDLVEHYHTTMKDLLDKHAPLLSKQSNQPKQTHGLILNLTILNITEENWRKSGNGLTPKQTSSTYVQPHLHIIKPSFMPNNHTMQI
jgi:hypothetical protein